MGRRLALSSLQESSTARSQYPGSQGDRQAAGGSRPCPAPPPVVTSSFFLRSYPMPPPRRALYLETDDNARASRRALQDNIPQMDPGAHIFNPLFPPFRRIHFWPRQRYSPPERFYRQPGFLPLCHCPGPDRGIAMQIQAMWCGPGRSTKL